MPRDTGSLFSRTVTGKIDDGVLLVEINNPPVNAASTDVRKGLLVALDYATRTRDVNAIVLTGKGSNFVAGADIREMDGPLIEPVLPVIIEGIEASAKPVVAAINGTALGGGLEIALACHKRIATRTARLGLPEVKLGIVPGAGGTQRLPRLTGMDTAAQMICSGRICSAIEAEESSIVDDIAEGDLIARATSLAHELSVSGDWRRTGDIAAPVLHREAVDAAIRPILVKARGIPAVAEALRLVKLSATMPFAQALAEERRTFLALRDSPEAAALRHIFFAERNVTRIPEIEGVEPALFDCVGVAGLGLMGAGISVALLNAGIEVVAIENSPEAAEAGRTRIENILQNLVKAGRLDEFNRLRRLARLTVGTDPKSLANAGLVIEAVPDDIHLKRNLFQRISEAVPRQIILATNTSYLDPLAIFQDLAGAERCLGMHFFSPAHIMRLVEVVKCPKTSAKTLSSAISLARRIGKLAVVCNSCEGFVGNRLFSAYRRQAEFLLEEGATPKQIDVAMESFGMAMGPFAVFDMTGLEIAWARRKREAAARDRRTRYVPIADWLCEAGRLGRKSGRGWYDYGDGEPKENPVVLNMIEQASRERGIARRNIDSGEIVERLLSAMAVEGARILGEKVVSRASDIDLVLVNGYGFPAHRGGPMFWADRHGLSRLLKFNERRYALDGPGLEVAPLLVQLAQQGSTFVKWQSERRSA